MDSANFATIGSEQGFNLENTGAGPYSVTAQFHLTTVSNGAGGFLSGASNATINLLAVPGPIVGAGLPGLIAACMGLFGTQPAQKVRRRLKPRNVLIKAHRVFARWAFCSDLRSASRCRLCCAGLIDWRVSMPRAGTP